VTAAVRGNGFSVGLPDGWIDRSVVTLVAPLEDLDGGSPSLVVTREHVGAGVDARGLARLQHAALRESGVDSLAVVETDRTLVAGREALRRTYRWRYGTTGMRQRLWCLVHAEVRYTITASAPEHRFDEHVPQFDVAVAAFRLDG
jgi:hypothetical protein